MRCPKCAAHNLDHAAFCRRCGTRLHSFCQSCNSANLPHFRYCANCGALLQPMGGEPAEPVPRTESRAAAAAEPVIEGERKHISVLFADISGSLEIIRDIDPEEARSIFDLTVEAVTAVIHRHKGTVNRVMGDGVLALFGAPAAQEQHAVNATLAGLDILRSIEALNRTLQGAHDVHISMHIGIDSGEVVVRSVTTDLHTEYDAVGRTVHMAARMQALAPAGAIRISVETAHQVEGFVVTRSLGTVRVKGLEDAVEIFEPLEPRPAATAFDLAKRRGLTAYVGRGRELHALVNASERIERGHGEIWAIVGEPGSGKSRLVHEFLVAGLSDWRIIEASCTAHGASAALAPIVALLKSYFAIHDAQSRDEVRALVQGALAKSSAPLTVPAVLSLLGIPTDDPGWLSADASSRRSAIQDILCTLLIASAERPIAVILQDLHWIDSESEAILDRLVQELPRGRVLVLVNFRPEYVNPWRKYHYSHRISLEPLPAESARAILDDLLDRDQSLVEIKELLLQRTGGNPLFIEESARALMDTGAISRSEGRLALARRIEGIRIPHTVHSILAARIDLLSPQDKAMLQSASVIGVTIGISLMFDIAGELEPAVLRSLDRLCLAGFLDHTKNAPEDEFVFKHPLIHEVAYNSILKSQRTLLHRKIVDAIERVHASRLTEFAQRLADHARQGEVWEKCGKYLRLAALNAYRRSANLEAARLFEQALEVLSLAPANRDNNSLRVDLCFDLRNALLLIGELRKILSYLAEAEILAEELRDDHRLAKLASYMSHAYWVSGDTRRALHYGENAIGYAERAGDAALVIPARYHVALSLTDLGELVEANRRLVELLDELGEERRYERFGLNAPLSVLAASYLARSLTEVGEFEAALRHGRRALRIAQEIDESFARAMAHLALGYAFLVKSDTDPALRHLEEAQTLFSTLNNRTMLTVIRAFIARAQLLACASAEGVELLESAVAQAEAMGMMSHQPLRLALLAEAHRMIGQGQAALGWSEQAVRLAKQQRERFSEAYAYWAKGRALAEIQSAGPRKAAWQAMRALVIADRSGMRPMAALCRLDLARCYRRLGKEAAAARESRLAIDEFRRMGMSYWESEASRGERSGDLAAAEAPTAPPVPRPR